MTDSESRRLTILRGESRGMKLEQKSEQSSGKQKKLMSLREILRSGEEYLKECGVADASMDAWLLLEHVTGLDRARYLARAEEPLEKVCGFLQTAKAVEPQARSCSADEVKPADGASPAMRSGVAEDLIQSYRELLEQRGRRIPLQHLIGEQEFMGFPFLVNEHVLIPRQDTETLVEEALKRLRPGMRVLDLCTGSGCIAVSLVKLGAEYIARKRARRTDNAETAAELLENARRANDDATAAELQEHAAANRMLCVDASDISPEALTVARENARRLGAQVHFVESDLFNGIDKAIDTAKTDEYSVKSGIDNKTDGMDGTAESDGMEKTSKAIRTDETTGRYDMIVSNPPYIRTAVIGELAEEVRLHEPIQALDGSEDGLRFYREIVRQSPAHLTEGGWLLFEIGYDQAEAVCALMAEAGFAETEVIRDLAGHDRVVIGRWCGHS